MSKYEVIIMDLDDTITDDLESKRGAFKRVCESLRLKYTDAHFKEFIDYDTDFWGKYESGKIIFPDHFNTFKQQLEYSRAQRFIHNFTKVDFQRAVDLNTIYCSAQSENVYFLEFAEEIIQYLASKYTLILATNGHSVSAKAKMQKINVSQYFQDIIIAEDIGVCKPETEFFKILMEKIGYYDVTKMAIIGDSISSDIAGGINMGIDTFWFNHRKNLNLSNLKITYEFNSLEHLYNVL